MDRSERTGRTAKDRSDITVKIRKSTRAKLDTLGDLNRLSLAERIDVLADAWAQLPEGKKLKAIRGANRG